MPDNNQTNYIPTMQPQPQTVTPEMLAAMREYSTGLNKQQSKPVGPFYRWAQGLADMSAKIMSGVFAGKADILQAAQNHQSALDAVRHLPGADSIVPPTDTPAQPAFSFGGSSFNPFGLLSGAPPGAGNGGGQ